METVKDYGEFEEKFEEFLKSKDQKSLFFHGDTQYERYKYVLKFINEKLRNRSILFRSNAMQNTKKFLNLSSVSSTKSTRLLNNVFYFDSYLTDRTMSGTPSDLDLIIVYPLEGIIREGWFDRVIGDLNDKTFSKVVFVSWLDESTSKYDYKIFEDYSDKIIKIKHF